MITMTCNKKSYSEFQAECEKCSMFNKCFIGGQSVAVGMLECPSITINVTFDGLQGTSASDIVKDGMAKEICNCLTSEN